VSRRVAASQTGDIGRLRPVANMSASFAFSAVTRAPNDAARKVGSGQET